MWRLATTFGKRGLTKEPKEKEKKHKNEKPY
jgi:hypothetical protein